MQEVVPSAVRAAVMAATSTFISTSQMLFFFMAHVFVEFVTSVDNLFGEDCAAFLPCHCPDEPRPVVFRQSLQAAEACPLADVLDVAVSAVFALRCPTADDVTNADGFVLPGIGAEDAEGGTQAPFHCLELDEGLVTLKDSLSFPLSTCNPPNVQRVAVSHSTCHGLLEARLKLS